MPFTKETAREAQLKGAAVRKSNSAAFDELGLFIIGGGAQAYREIVENYFRTGDYDKFVKSYEAMLEYFKPKLARTESEVKITQKMIKLDDE